MSFLLSLSRGEALSVWFHRLWPEFFSLWPAQTAPEETHRFDPLTHSVSLSLSLFIIFRFLCSLHLLSICCSHDSHFVDDVFWSAQFVLCVRWCITVTLSSDEVTKGWLNFGMASLQTSALLYFSISLSVCVCMCVCVMLNMCFLYVYVCVWTWGCVCMHIVYVFRS